MLSRLILRNFQRHAKLDIPLALVTTFVGDSDSGKSAVIRALRWVMTNSPRGSSFIKHGTDKCSVTLYVDDHKIKRSRTASDNLYELDGEVFKSFGIEVPEPIQNALRVNADTFQQQHDGVFWLSLSATEVSKRLNEISDLQIMDDSLREVNSRKRETDQRLKLLKEQRTGYQERVESLKHVPKMASRLESLERMHTETTQKAASIPRLISLADTLTNTTSDAARLETEASGLQKLVTYEKALHDKQDKCEQLEILIDQLKRIRIPDAVELKRLQDESEKLQTLKARPHKLNAIITSISLFERDITKCRSRHLSLKASLKKTSPKTCKECGRPL